MPDDTRALREDERAEFERLHPDVFTRSRREIAEAAFIAGLRYPREVTEAEVEAGARAALEATHGLASFALAGHAEDFVRAALEAARKVSQ